MKRWIHDTDTNAKQRVSDIAESLYDCAPDLADDMLYGMNKEQLQEMWSLEDFKYYLESKAEEGGDELEFESDAEIDEWVNYIIDNSIFKKQK